MYKKVYYYPRTIIEIIYKNNDSCNIICKLIYKFLIRRLYILDLFIINKANFMQADLLCTFMRFHLLLIM